MNDQSPRSKGSPRFYAEDITSILRERNELKERVLELEEEVEALKREITRLSNFGTLTLSPDVVRLRKTRGNAFLETSRDPPKPAAAALQKVLKSCTSTHHYVSDVEVTGYLKKGGYYVYVIKLVWSDGQRYEIYRRYGEFFTFQHTLLQLFPEESGKGSASRIIPSLPTIDNILSLFGRTNTESVMKTRLATINEYCQVLLLHLDIVVSRSPHVLNFFKPAIGDTQLSRLKKKTSDVDLSILSVYPQNKPAGSLFEEWVVLANYEATTTAEISAQAGDKVKVIKKEDSGWWLVTKTRSSSNGATLKKEQMGYIASDYLKPYKDHDTWKSMSNEDLQKYLGFVGPEEMEEESTMDTDVKYMVIQDYHTEDPCQLSLTEEEIVLVMEKSEDGWWLVLCNKRQGWVPASYLHPFNDRSQLDSTTSAACNTESATVQDKGNGAEEEAEESYVAVAGYCGEHPEDVSFTEGAIVTVLEKSAAGWWVIRYKGKVGVAPSSLLELPPTPVTPLPLRNDIVSGIKTPPPRSNLFRQHTQRKILEKSNSVEIKVSDVDNSTARNLCVRKEDHEPSRKNSIGSKIIEGLRSPLGRRKVEQCKQKDNNIPLDFKIHHHDHQ